MPTVNFAGVTHYSDNPDEPVLFYGGLFSNFTGRPIQVNAEQPWAPNGFEETYDTVEHFFQASKATTRRDHVFVNRGRHPGEAKRRGRLIDLRRDWEEVKFIIMITGLRAKFQDPGYAEFLLNTGDRFIAEDSPTDDEWGIRDADGGWTGDNLLGKALMEIREELR